jgi:hypothetical protein
MKTKCYSVTILALMIVLSIHNSYSQTVICQTPEASINSAGENAFNQYVIKFKNQGKHLNTDLKIIPVVIHVIYRNSVDRQQITMARIEGQIDATNKQLRRLNANAKETRKIFLPVAADCNIQVCLATRKPDRSAFSGVIYHNYPNYVQARDLAAIRTATTLDPDRYLNVWVTPDTSFASAIFPWDGTTKRDGFEIGAEVFGIRGSNLNPEINLGVTFTHELAHYLGVLHTFHFSFPLLDQCDLIHDASIGDLCGDTPLDWDEFSAYKPCNNGERFCSNDGSEYSFFVQSENYMYYAFDSCLNMFSKDQRARMRACLYRFRSKLTLPSNLKLTGVSCNDLYENCNSCSTSFASTGTGYNDLKINKTHLEKKITVSPNPTNGIIHLVYHDLPIKKDISVIVYNSMAQKLKEVRSKTAINELNLNSFAEGVYYIKVTIDGESVTKYIIKTGPR